MLAFPRSARRGPLLFLITVLLIVGFLAHRSRFLIGLLFEKGYPEVIDPVRLLDSPGAEEESERQTPLIPQIIHQTFKNASLPEEWIVSQDACQKLHPEFKYMFWTDESALELIASEYPWFLPTYVSYPYAIQRVDAFRYFVLAHYGGIYLDLDIEPSRTLHPLLQFPAWACRTAPTGISNDALGASPGHPFYKHVIASLETYNRNWGLPYVTIMYSTGPLFLSVMWEEYIATQTERPYAEQVWVLSRETHYEDTYGFFYNHEGGSWHGRDMAVIFWMGQHWLIVTVLGVGTGIGIFLAAWWCVRRFSGADREPGGYKPIMRSA